MKLGKFDISLGWDGFFKLDGGAMFGVVPKSLWSKTDEADAKNRILLSMNPMVIRNEQEIILVDTGIGDKFSDKQTEIFGLNRENNLLKSLMEMGIDREEVTGVIMTHLHFDHAGGNTYLDDKGNLHPTFPNATHYIQKGEWELAMSPNARTKASYLKENYEPLMEKKLIKFLDGDSEIVSGVRVEVTAGHTDSHQIVLVESEGKTACYLADLIPTASHIKIPYIMGYDTHPLETLAAKQRLVPQAIKEKWITLFAHSPRMKAGYIEEGEDPDPRRRGPILKTIDINKTQ